MKERKEEMKRKQKGRREKKEMEGRK